MFGWFSPKCPLEDPREKAWTELRMLWLSQQFGIERMRQTDILLPNSEHFPEPFDGQVETAGELMQRLCRHMQLDASELELRIHTDAEMPAAAGEYEPKGENGALIRIAESQLADLELLLATLARELSHHLLLGEGRLSADDDDHESVTDLLPVFLGLGVFGANATLRETMETSGGWHRWSISRQGYLPARIHGYALALFAWIRGEFRPDWASALRLDARDVFHKSLRYLRQTEDSLFRPDCVLPEESPAPLFEVTAELRSPHPGRRVAALWELGDRGEGAKDAADDVMAALSDGNSSVRTIAVETISMIGVDVEPALPRLVERLRDGKIEVRIAAVLALAKYRQKADPIVGELTASLQDPSLHVVSAAVSALADFAAAARDSADDLISPLRSALVECEYQLIDAVLATLVAIHDRPREFLQIAFADDDEEILRRALGAFDELRRDALEVLGEEKSADESSVD
ncbi:MAG: HEAT repeat domain-containing protein [Planctomycetes bacterium]|nr:HEAT repeat domain-containing protein [Planctomycetota bacterium]